MSNILASGISNIPHFAAFDLVAEKRFNEIDWTKLLVYIIDNVDASAIPTLAAQFDVLGYKGMRLATTEAQQREVIKRAIELKRYNGTVWAVKEALKTIGYPNATVYESVGVGANGWAEFRIALDAGENIVSASSIDDVFKMIDEYKNARSHLVGVSFIIDLGSDAIALADESSEMPSVNEEDAISVGSDFRYNGEYAYNGAKNYSSDSDILDLEIIT